MHESTHDIETRDGTMPVYIAFPEGDGPLPVVLYLMDAIGVRRELEEGARRLAAEGYYVMLPDLYYREGRYRELDITASDAWDTIMKLLGTVSHASVCSDIDAALHFAAGQARADVSRIGAVGYCMGGALAVRVADHLGPRLRAAAAIHPGNLVNDGDESPHRHVGHIAGTLYFAIADNDPYATPEDVERLKGALDEAGVDYEVEFYTGAEHGFTFPSLPSYDREASERQWQRVFSMMAQHLP